MAVTADQTQVLSVGQDRRITFFPPHSFSSICTCSHLTRVHSFWDLRTSKAFKVIDGAHEDEIRGIAVSLNFFLSRPSLDSHLCISVESHW